MKAVLLALLALATTLSHADKVDDLVRAQMKAQQIPGFSLLITKNDKVIRRSVYGKADLEQSSLVNKNSVFESGSIGKSFTATVILQLREQGKLDLDDPVSKYLDGTPETWSAITIRRMLSHTSGLKDYALVPGLGLIEHWTKDDWFAKMKTLPLDFATGSSFAYSNSNYLLLGLVAEKVTGKPIVELVQERVFRPLGMTRSFVADEMTVIPDRAHGYLHYDTQIVNGPAIAPGYGDGSFINSCEDLATYEKGIREGKILKPESVKLMQSYNMLPTGRRTPYGFGWFVRDVNGVRCVSHGGNTAACSASLFRIPSANLTVVLMCNINDVGGDGVAQRIAELYVPELKFKPLAERPDPDAGLSAQLLRTLLDLAVQKVNPADLDPEMTARLATGRGQMGLATLARFAKVSKLTFLQSEPYDVDTIYRYRVTVDGKPWMLTFMVNKDRKVFSIGSREEA